MTRRPTPPRLSLPLSRRHLLRTGLAAAAVWTGAGGLRAQPFEVYPFGLGVASGSPTPFGVILWTRVTFPPPPPVNLYSFEKVALPSHPPVDLIWEVAEDAGFARTLQSGQVRCTPAFGHSAHVAVTGLAPDRWYFYRFRAGLTVSPVGRTRTAPAADALPGASMGPMRLAFASCQQYEQGYYAALRDMSRRDLDLVVHLGDYIYEMSYGADHVRSHGTGNPLTLDDYRARYALYKSDPDLQAAHAAAPWLAIWDDHEVANNYHNDDAPRVQGGAPFLKMRAAAYQAWYEHMPVPPHAGGDFAHFRIYGSHGFGGLLDLALLDDRQYRSAALPDHAGQDSPARTMLGAQQERWLDATLKGSKARWTVIAQQTLLSERDLEEGPDERFSLDTWDGYRHARARLLTSVQEAGLANPLVIGGDLHAFYAADVKRDFGVEGAPTLATEFVTGAITSNPPSETAIARALAENPHLRFATGRQHGYGVMTLDADSAQVDFIAISDRKDPQATARVAQSFAVLDGRPGVNRI